MRSINHFINHQIGKWELERDLEERREEAVGWRPQPWIETAGRKGPFKPVITLAPKFGCASRIVSRVLSRRTGYGLFGFSLIDKVAADMNVRRQMIDRMDQRLRSYVRTMVDGLLQGRYVEQEDYFRHLVHVLNVFIHEGGCILVGRGAPYLVGPGAGIRVRLTASDDKRIANLMQFYNIGAKEAEDRMRKSDEERAASSQKYYELDIDDPCNYDMVINLDRLTPETTAHIVLRALDVMHQKCPHDIIWRTGRQETPHDIVSRQIDKWEYRQQESLKEFWHEEEMGEGESGGHHRLPCIAFMPEFCSGSRLVSEVLHERLGYETIGYKLIDHIAEDMQLSPRIIDRLDQRAQSALQSLIDTLTEGQHINRADYFRSLVRVVRAFIVQGGVTLLGRGTPFLVEEHEGVRVRLVASNEVRLKNLEEFYGLYGKEAESRLAKGDAERAEFIRQFFRADINTAENYDVTLNMDRLTPKAGAEIVLRSLEHLLV
jgi:cytidylate kinase